MDSSVELEHESLKKASKVSARFLTGLARSKCDNTLARGSRVGDRDLFRACAPESSCFIGAASGYDTACYRPALFSADGRMDDGRVEYVVNVLRPGPP